MVIYWLGKSNKAILASQEIFLISKVETLLLWAIVKCKQGHICESLPIVTVVIISPKLLLPHEVPVSKDEMCSSLEAILRFFEMQDSLAEVFNIF